MEDTIFILGEDGKLIEMNESFYDSEELLQRLLNDYPMLAGSGPTWAGMGFVNR